MQIDPADEIKRIRKYYETKSKQGAGEGKPPVTGTIGDIYLNTTDNQLYICIGKVNGRAVWSHM